MPGDEGGREVDVVDDGQAGVVAGAHGVGGRQHGRARIERRNDARLGHRHRLLLHNLVQLHANCMPVIHCAMLARTRQEYGVPTSGEPSDASASSEAMSNSFCSQL